MEKIVENIFCTFENQNFKKLEKIIKRLTNNKQGKSQELADLLKFTCFFHEKSLLLVGDKS